MLFDILFIILSVQKIDNILDLRSTFFSKYYDTLEGRNKFAVNQFLTHTSVVTQYNEISLFQVKYNTEAIFPFQINIDISFFQ